MSKRSRKNKTRIRKGKGVKSQEVIVRQSKDLLVQSSSKIGILADLLVVVCVAVVIVHWPALSAKALSFDDGQYLIKNFLVQNPSWTSTWRFLSEVLEPSTVKGYYQPLTMISLMLDYAMGGRVDNLLPFHLTSLALHVANTALIIVLLYLFFDHVWIAAAVGLLFGLHPMTVETIPWVGERKTLLAAFFALWSLIFYIRFAHGAGWKFYIGCMVTYILAVMSKPTSLMLPTTMVLIDFWPLKRLSWRTISEKIPLFVIAGIFAFITLISQSRTASVAVLAEHVVVRIAMILCHNIIFYLHKIILPINLSSHYPFPEPLGLSNPAILAGVIGTLVMAVLLAVSLRRTRAALTGWLIFFVTILPTMQIIGFTNVIASDKYAYLPSIGLLMVFASLLIWFCCAAKTSKKLAVIIIILLLACGESIATRRYLVHWRDTKSLSEYMLSMSPDAVLVHNNLGNALALQGSYDEALEHFNLVLQSNPENADIHYNIATVLQSQGKLDDAMKEYLQVLKFAPNHADSLNNVGIIFQSREDFGNAIMRFRKVLLIEPENPYAHFNLGKVLKLQNKLDEAIHHFRQAIKFKPDHDRAHNLLGEALQSQGKVEQAIPYFREALNLNPDFVNAYNNMGIALQSQGLIDEAISYYQQVAEIAPDNASVYFNLGSALKSQRKLDEAAGYLRRAIELKPDYAEAHNNLGNVLQLQGKLDEAVGHFKAALEINPADAFAHYNLSLVLRATGDFGQSLEHLQRTADLKPDWPAPLSTMAWMLATNPDSKLRDGQKAMAFAERAAEMTRYQNPVVLDALAVSYAAVGKFDQAEETAQTAIKIAVAVKAERLANQIRVRLELYRQKKPYLESSMPSK
ncbi:MAG: tetratricopeptide repeat protein [Planctomycetes bacterium]|nr:tetratricopeptide repeat protein [Planctomycetota bacterium]